MAAQLLGSSERVIIFQHMVPLVHSATSSPR